MVPGEGFGRYLGEPAVQTLSMDARDARIEVGHAGRCEIFMVMT